MAWIFNDANAVTNVIEASQGRTYYEFRRAVRDQGMHPRAASESMGHLGYENLGNCYSIRLSGGHRVYFTVDEPSQTVTVLQVGGHR